MSGNIGLQQGQYGAGQQLGALGTDGLTNSQDAQIQAQTGFFNNTITPSTAQNTGSSALATGVNGMNSATQNMGGSTGKMGNVTNPNIPINSVQNSPSAILGQTNGFNNSLPSSSASAGPAAGTYTITPTAGDQSSGGQQTFQTPYQQMMAGMSQVYKGI